MAYSWRGKRILVTGSSGMVGGAIVRRLRQEPCTILAPRRAELDLTRQADVERWMEAERPQAVVVAAAKVGGIHANATYPADFLYENLVIETNLIHAAHRVGVEKLLFLGSTCIYPRDAAQPMREEALLTGPLEATNEWYAIAKIAGLKLCQAYRRQFGDDFISAMPTNLFGPGDNFHPENAHVPAALLGRFHRARVERMPEVAVWGTGRPLRDFLFVDDLADACVHLLEHYSGEVALNIGSGREVSIGEFARLIAAVVGYEGRIVFDTSRPDGTPRKGLDVSRLSALGWRPTRTLEDALRAYYAWFLDHQDILRQH
ncbi:GDP-L-fucose synthase family protein [Alsobacter sp. R-9]